MYSALKGRLWENARGTAVYLPHDYYTIGDFEEAYWLQIEKWLHAIPSDGEV